MHTMKCGTAKKSILSKSIALVVAGMTSSTWAEPPRRAALEEVIVTAQKRDELLQNVPVAISAFDEEALQKMGFTNIGNLQEKVPSLTIAPFVTNSSQLTIFMRGIGTIDGDQLSRDGGVAIYVDDVYLGRSQGLSGDLADVERIEVLKGPQGTLYGRNTTGGAIKYITSKPTGEFGLKQDVTLGNYDRFRSVTNLDLPAYGIVSTKFSYLVDNRDGIVRNTGFGPDWGQYNKTGYRLDLLAKPSDTLSIEYAYDHSKQLGTSYYMQQIDQSPYAFFRKWKTPIQKSRRSVGIRASNLPTKDNFELGGHALTVGWDISPSVSLKSITAYRSLDANNLVDAMDAFNTPSLYKGDTYQSQWSQEFTANGSAEHLEWVAGLYYFRESGNQKSGNLKPPGASALIVNPNSTYDIFREPMLSDLGPSIEANAVNTAGAIYGQGTWKPGVFDDKLSLTLGGRFSKDWRWVRRSEVFHDGGSKRFTSFDPTAIVDYMWTESAHTYLKYSRAYRAGGFNIRTPVLSQFDPEYVNAYELGLKSQWLDNRLRLNIAGFISKYRDIQVDFTDTELKAHTINGPGSTIKGVEVEVTAVPVDGLQVKFDYAHLATHQDTLRNPFDGTVLPETTFPFAPHNKYVASFDYAFPSFDFGQLQTNIAYTWTSQYSTMGGPYGGLYWVDSYGVLDARVTLADIPVSENDRGKLNLSLWGKNVLNKEYLAFAGFGGALFADPRTFGVEAIYKY